MRLLIVSLLIHGCMSASVSAHHNTQRFNAKVVKVTPVYQYVTVNKPIHYCQSNQHKAYPLTSLGGVIGGVIGHAVSDKNHKGLGTVIGAVIGSSLLHTVEHSQRQHCTSKYSISKVRRLKGYDVTYHVRGQQYVTFMREKPSKTIHVSS